MKAGSGCGDRAPRRQVDEVPQAGGGPVGPKLRDRVDLWVAQFDRPRCGCRRKSRTAAMSKSADPCGDGRHLGQHARRRAAASTSGWMRWPRRCVTTIRAPGSSAARMRAGRWRAARATLACQCGSETARRRPSEKPSAQSMIHVLAEQATIDGAVISPAICPASGSCPPIGAGVGSRRDAQAVGGADGAPDPGVSALGDHGEFVRWRDLTCRWPGCHGPVDNPTSTTRCPGLRADPSVEQQAVLPHPRPAQQHERQPPTCLTDHAAIMHLGPVG